MPPRTDSDLLEAYATSRDEAAFAELVARHQRMVYRVCRRLLGQHQEAEDATQAVFLVLLEKGRRLTRQGELTGWLYGVARNVALAARRQRCRRQEDFAMRHEPEAPATTNEADHQALLLSLDAELDGLSAVLRQAVLLRYLQGYDQVEAARLAGCSAGTLSVRASRGLERLRQRLARRGLALNDIALLGLLAAEAAAPVPATLLPAVLATAKALAATGLPVAALGAPMGAAAAGVSAPVLVLAKGALKTMFWIQVKTLAALGVAAVLAASAVPLGLAAAQALSRDTAAPAAAAAPAVAGTAATKLSRKDKPGIVGLGNVNLPDISPSMRRGLPLSPREIEGQAAARDLKVAWVRDGQWAVIYAGVADAEVERVRKDLSATAAEVRCEAAWRGGWMSDPRLVPLLRQAANDADPAVARQALEGLRRLGWRAVLALDGTAIPLLEKEIADRGDGVGDVCLALVQNGGRDALTLLAKALDHPDPTGRVRLAAALGLRSAWDVPSALPLLEKALADPDFMTRSYAAESLGILGKDLANGQVERALALLDQAFPGATLPAGERGWLAYHVTGAVAQIGGAKALAILERWIADPEAFRRRYAADALGRMGGDQVLELLEKALADADPQVRDAATIALARRGDGKSLALVEKRFSTADAKVRAAVASSLGAVSRELSPAEAGLTLALLDQALADGDAEVRRSAANALPSVAAHLPAEQAEKALALLAKALDDPDGNVRNGVGSALENGRGGKQADAILNLMLAQPKSRCAALRILGRVLGEQALTQLEVAFADPDARVRGSAVDGVAQLDGERALALIEKALADPDASVRRTAVYALGRGGGQQALALREKALLDRDASVRGAVAFELAYVGGEKSQLLLEQALADQDAGVRSQAVEALGRLGGERSGVLIARALADPEVSVRRAAWSALGGIGGEKAMAFREQVLLDTDPVLRQWAAAHLAYVGGDQALLRLEQALADPDASVRQSIVEGLIQAVKRERQLRPELVREPDRDKRSQQLCNNVRDLLLKQLTREDNGDQCEAIVVALRTYYPNDPVVAAAFKAAEIRK